MFSWSNVSCNLEFDCVVFFKSIDLTRKHNPEIPTKIGFRWVWDGLETDFCSGCHYLTPCDGVENPTVDPAMRMTIIEFDGNIWK